SQFSSFVFSHLLILFVTSTLWLTVFFFDDPAPTEIYTLSLHYALPISGGVLDEMLLVETIFLKELRHLAFHNPVQHRLGPPGSRSEEHTSELQSRRDLVCRLLLEKKKLRKQRQRQLSPRRALSDPVLTG